MNRYLLDTSVIIDCLRGKKPATKLVSGLEGERASSLICLAELYEGVNQAQSKNQAEREVLDFFQALNKVYGLNENIAKTFGKIRAELKSEGKIIQDLDILIAATCIVHHLTLVTSNTKHFRRVKDLEIL